MDWARTIDRKCELKILIKGNVASDKYDERARNGPKVIRVVNANALLKRAQIILCREERLPFGKRITSATCPIKRKLKVRRVPRKLSNLFLAI